MQLLNALLPLLGALPFAFATSPLASVTLRIPATHHLPNPFALSPATHATLSTFGKSQAAPLSTTNTFVFHNVTPGSYLVDVHCTTHAFAPLRLDVAAPSVDDPAAAKKKKSLALKAWETYRGNEWDNKGEAVPLLEGGVFEVRLLGTKGYFMERSKFNVFSILKNPMILLGLVSMAIFLGMPYLVDNMDPEMRAEWDERQKSNPMNGIMGAATGQPSSGNPVANFDMAAFLAGSSSKKDDTAGASAIAAALASSDSGNKNNNKKRR